MSKRTRWLLTLVGTGILLVGPPDVSAQDAGTITIDTDDFTVTGDGDGNPHAFRGLSFTTDELPGPIAGFFVNGDLVIRSDDTVVIQGSRGLSLQVGGDMTIESGALIDASATAMRPGPGGGIAGGTPSGGSGGTRGDRNYPGTYTGYGGAGGSAGVCPFTSGSRGGDGQQGTIAPSGSGGYLGGAGRSYAGEGGVNAADGGGNAGTAGSAGPGGAGPSTRYGAAGGSGGSGGWDEAWHGWPGSYGSTGPTGAAGGIGGQGGNGGAGLNTGAGSLISAGGGGGSGGSGGGGGGGSGGWAGTGGGGGGGGGGSSCTSGGHGGRGGIGGAGGLGGYGGRGGSGGPGGHGGGALEIVALGNLVVAGEIRANGAGGHAPAMAAQSGSPGSAGYPGEAGIAGQNTSVADGGRGGNGGNGGGGGTGGSGGDGAPGGGGAAGTIRLAAMHIDSVNATISAMGGAGGSVGQNDGGVGRFIFDTADGAMFAGALFGPDSPDGTDWVPMDSNPFIVGEPETPVIPFLEGGPDVYGIAVGIDASALDAIHADAPEWAALAIALVDSPTDVGVQWEVDEFDLLLVTNVRRCPIRAPHLGIGTTTAEQALLERGPSNHPDYGGAGARILGVIESGQTYVTMVPEGQSDYALSALHRSAWMSTYTPDIPEGTASYLVQPDELADCNVFVDLIVPMETPRLERVRTTVQTNEGDVEVDLVICYDEKGNLIADGPCAMGETDVTVAGDVSFKKGAPVCDLNVKGEDGSKCRIKSPVEEDGSATGSVAYRSAQRKKTKADTPITMDVAAVVGSLVLYPEIDEKGKLTGSGDFLAGFGNDPGGAGALKGKIKRDKLTFTFKVGKQKLTFKGQLDGDAFLGTLKVKALPEKGAIRNYRVADPRQFH